MSINSAIDTAAAGLRATQAGLAVVSQNVANSGSVGYTRRTLSTTETVSGTHGSGVDVGNVQRTLDTMLQKQLRLETAGAAYTSAIASTGTALDAAFDQTSGSSSLSSLVTAFTGSLQSLNSDPSSYQNKSAVLTAATDLAGSLNTLSDTVQTLRQGAENTLNTDVDASNDLLKQIASVNKTITSSPAAQTSAALLDQRDALVDKLSSYMDLSVTPGQNGSITISTTGGLQLFDGNKATQLTFDARSPLMAESAYSTDPAKRTVGTITATYPDGSSIDAIASGAIRSGDIAAQVELRDTVLPQAETQLDTLAAGLATALSDNHVAGTAVASPPGYTLDLSNLSNGKAASVTYVDANNTTQTINLVRVDDAASLAKVSSTNGGNSIGIDFSGASGSVASQITAALANTGLTVSASGQTMTVTGAAAPAVPRVTALTKAVPVTATQTTTVPPTTVTAVPELALFVDGGKTSGNNVYTGTLTGTPQLTGFAGRITVNSAVTSNPDLLVDYDSTTLSGDTTRPAYLLNQLTSATQSFTPAAGIGTTKTGFTGSFSDYAQQVISFQASASSSATNLDSGQQTVLNSVLDRYSSTAGVNIDTELTQLIQLQTAYSANARIMTAAKDMLDMLLSSVQ